MKVAAEFPAYNLAMANLETAAALVGGKDVATTGYFPDHATNAAEASPHPRGSRQLQNRTSILHSQPTKS